MEVSDFVGLWRMVIIMAGATAASLSGGLAVEPEPGTLLRQQCEASAQSDGTTATAVGWCLHRSDGTPAGAGADSVCDELTHELAVADDAELAVFAEAVVRGYRPADPSREGRERSEGTLINVTQVPFEPGAPAPSPTYDRPILVAQDLDVGSRLFSATGRWWNRTCWTHGPDGALIGTVEGPLGEGVVVPLSDLIAVALARVRPPPLPPVRHAGPSSITQLATWFWIDPDWWDGDYSHSARHGLVSVTVSATPRRWSLIPLDPPGPPLLECGRGGINYRPDGDSLACTTTFSTPPPGGTIDLRAEAELGVQWSTTLAGYGLQRLPPMVRSSDVSHSVVEVVGLRTG